MFQAGISFFSDYIDAMPSLVIKKKKTDGFLLSREFDGVELTIKCRIRINNYNEKQKLLQDEEDLYECFKNAATKKALEEAVEKLFLR